ncbi:MAG: beta-lactamase family protein, partial [Planctomycetes bacterium]|nr:beta-lactamase family protein [Planctomycetota bacterium]
MPLPTLRAFAVSLFAATLLAQAPTPLTADRIAELTKSARELFGAQGLAVAVVQDGTVLASIGVGERAPGQPMTQHTVTNIASCSKAFTAASVALLVQEGKLAWDDPVQKHLPEFRLADPWISSHMTVRDLLSHRCGLVTFAGDLLWYGSDYDDAEVLRRAAGLPIVQRFREQFGYQNLMYMAAG